MTILQCRQFPTRRGAGRGFTLVELVAVIVILGVLAAHAAPRFLDIADDAHQVVVAQTAGTFGTAVRQAYIGCVVRNYAGRDNLSGFGAGDVDFNANCYPASTNGNNGNVNANRCVQVWNGVLALAPSISTPASDITDYRAQGGGTLCTFTYRVDDDDLRRFTYNTSDGLVTVVSNP
jgi:MSHA pilin protein MshB